MGTTADKLTYLSNTKSLLKYRLNSLGATITGSTSFRNYLTWLDTFYNDVSDKTDLATNGLKGRTNQSGTPTPDSPQAINNLTGNISYTVTIDGDSKTFTIPLGNIELCNINNEYDCIYSSNGKFYLHKSIDKVLLDGSNDEKYTIDNKYGSLQYRSFNFKYSDYVKNSSECYCNKLVYSENSLYTTDTQGVKPTSSGDIKIKIFDNTLQSVDLFTVWLSSNNLLIYFILKNATTTEITSSNYPQLYTALKEIQDYLTKYKINNEFILEASSPTINY